MKEPRIVKVAPVGATEVRPSFWSVICLAIAVSLIVLFVIGFCLPLILWLQTYSGVTVFLMVLGLGIYNRVR
jgi:hypothetical protein